MKNQDYEDFEQVYTVDDSDDFNGDGSNLLNSRSGEVPPIVSLAVLLFIPLVFSAIIASAIAKSSILNYGEVFIPLAVLSFVGVYFFISSAPKPEDVEQRFVPQSKKASKSKGRKKKKSLLSDDFDDNSHVTDNYISEVEKNKAICDKELAICALVKLGLGKKKAKELVDRGVASGLKASDTQVLIEFALAVETSRRGLFNK